MSVANVDLQALEDLQKQLRRIAGMLKEYSEQINASLSVTSGEWRDSRFDRFAEEFQRHRSEIENISESYHAWADGYLESVIEKVKEYNIV